MIYRFSQIQELPDFTWHCPPPTWGFGPEGLFIQPAAATDFWQRTHYGFSADNGHFLHTTISEDFVLETTVRLEPKHQYDQAGLMVRLDAECWIKTSVEYEVGSMNRLGVVVTHHGFSDWSTQDVASDIDTVSFRIARQGNEFLISARFGERDWMQLRMVRLACDARAAVAIGPYACSPKDAGFRCVFRELSLESPAK